MRIGDAFPSAFLKASDLQGRSFVVTIDTVVTEEMIDGKKKPVVHFQGTDKGLVLNMTNANAMSKAFGSDETDTWKGQSIELFASTTDFMGDVVDCIRVRAVPDQAPAQAQSAAPPAAPPADPPGLPPPSEGASGSSANDELPF